MGLGLDKDKVLGLRDGSMRDEADVADMASFLSSLCFCFAQKIRFSNRKRGFKKKSLG